MGRQNFKTNEERLLAAEEQSIAQMKKSQHKATLRIVWGPPNAETLSLQVALPSETLEELRTKLVQDNYRIRFFVTQANTFTSLDPVMSTLMFSGNGFAYSLKTTGYENKETRVKCVVEHQTDPEKTVTTDWVGVDLRLIQPQ